MDFFAEIGSVAVKSAVATVVLFILTRIMGKKQISQLTYFDYIVGISIGSVAAALSVEKSISLRDGISSMVVWAAFPLILSFVVTKSMNARRLLDGTPTILIQDGKIMEKNLRKVKFTVNDLLEELRLKDVFNIGDVEFALLETSGKVSVLKKSGKLAVTNAELKLPDIHQGLSANIIIDGKVMTQNLALLHKDEAWVFSELKKRKISSVKNVLFACCDPSGTLHIDLKNSDPESWDVLH